MINSKENNKNRFGKGLIGTGVDLCGHYDIIGDVHGHADQLEALLETMDYQNISGVWQHPERLAVFVGDLIDRGPENFRTIEIVKAMTDNGHALITMGNHEYNALCFHTTNSAGNFLRRHSEKNIHQHKEVLEEIDAGGSESETKWREYLDWFRRMPFFLELNGVNVVHACWDRKSVDFFKENPFRDSSGRVTDGFLRESTDHGGRVFKSVEILMKGAEIPLPSGHEGILCKDGTVRRWLRLRWWMAPEEWQNATRYDQVVRADPDVLGRMNGLEIPGDILEYVRNKWTARNRGNGAGSFDTPVFVGHYWFTGNPRLLTGKVASLDYSVARGGKMVAYRWDGENILEQNKFVAV